MPRKLRLSLLHPVLPFQEQEESFQRQQMIPLRFLRGKSGNYNQAQLNPPFAQLPAGIKAQSRLQSIRQANYRST